MKIAVSAQGNQPSSLMDPRFGRAAGFLIYDTDSKSYSFVDNASGVEASQGAGIQSAQSVAQAGAEVVITGQTGPKAEAALRQGNIRIVSAASGKTVEEVVQNFLSGKLGAETGPDEASPKGTGTMRGGRGMGGGGGRGMGGGGGRGMGGGGGRRMG